MKKVLLKTAWEWKQDNAHDGKRIIAKIIEVLSLDKMMNNKG